MNRILPVAVLLSAASVAAQSFLHLPASQTPELGELPHYSLRPLMQVDSRVQMFFDATEVGSSSFTATGLAMRYDGPIPQVGAPGPFAIQRLQIRIGATQVALPGAAFAGNLTQPLTTVFDGPWSFLPDPGTAAPHGWGEPNGALSFPFTSPTPVAIPQGGWLVIEIAMQGNNIANFGYSHALIDGARMGGGVVDGSATPFGQGCAIPGSQPATIGATGTFAPGAAHFVNGQNLGANAPVFQLFGLDNANSAAFGPLPFQLPGTSCALLQSSDVNRLVFADGNGAIARDLESAAFVVPPVPAFSGVVLHEQLLAYAPGANTFDFVLSNALTVNLGSLTAPGIGVYSVSHGARHDAAIADKVEPFGYGVRLSTL